ncbi:MAG TPA: pyrroloquinoline quinone biosynthesis peptide chaperone PqqD [Ktedonobacteraceae bacterium]|jgi:pyrroloquinoline quinone biosynthesis protein D|nr:pyrroloquinoline quinone biosynthesis peptide chaperone PqqD [Ktedonobacteraceae bacterium]
MRDQSEQDKHIRDSIRPLVAAKARLQKDKVSGEPILLYPEGLLQLNATGAEILRLCDGHHTFREIVVELARCHNTTPEALHEDVDEYLNNLYQHALLELRTTEPSELPSHREPEERKPGNGGPADARSSI